MDQQTKGASREEAKRRRINLPISLVLMASIGFLVLVAVGVVLQIGYRVAGSNTAELVRQKSELVIHSIVERTRSHLDPVRAQVDYLAEAMAGGAVDLDDQAALGTLLSSSLAAAPQVSVAAFVYPDLKILRAFRQRREDRVVFNDWSDDLAFRDMIVKARAHGERHWGPLFYAEPVERTYLNLLAPVWRSGAYRGMLIASVSTRALSTFLVGLETRLTGQAFILFDRQFVLAHRSLVQPTPGLSDAQPLPALAGFSDPILHEIWSTERRTDTEAQLVNDLDARVVAAADDTYVFLFRDLEGYGEQPWQIGTYFPLDDLAPQLGRLKRIGQVGLAVLLVAIAVAFLLGRVLTRPIRLLADAATRVRGLDLEGTDPIPRGPFREINQAADAFNAMVNGLKSFETYVPRALVQKLMARSGNRGITPEEHEITVLFTDIVGFTQYAEHQPAGQVLDFLNGHFALVEACVEAEDGTVDKYIGDAVMAFWGAPEAQSDHAARACRAALRIAEAIGADNAKRRAQGQDPVRVRIGLHSGSAVVGNIGGFDRVNYTVIGDTVNIAERLEMVARETGSLDQECVAVVSGETARAADGGFDFAPLGKRVLPGRHRDTEVFRLEARHQASPPEVTDRAASA